MAQSPLPSVTSRHVAKGAGSTLLARLGAVIEIITQPLYVALFGLASFGLHAVLWAAVNVLENIFDLGMTGALQRTVPQARTEAEAVASLRSAVLLGVVPCSLVAAIVTVTAPSLTHIFNANIADSGQLEQIIPLFVWTLPLWAFVEIATSGLRARQVFGAEVRIRWFWEQVVRLIVTVILWRMGIGTIALFYAHLISLGVIALICIRMLGRYYDLRLLFVRTDERPIWKDTLFAGLAILPSNIVARLFSDAPTIALNAWLPGANGAAAAGLFAIARKISSIVQLVRIAFAHVLAPLASLASTANRSMVQDIYGFATRISISVALPLGAVLMAWGGIILDLFGAQARAAVPALIVLTAARVIEAITGTASPVQQVISGYRSQLVGSILGAAFAVAIGWAVMPAGGLTGVTIAVSIGIVVAAVVPLWQVHHYDRIHPFAPPFTSVAMRATAIAAVGGTLSLLAVTAPAAAHMPLFTLCLLASLWCSARFTLPVHDRAALGKVGRALRITGHHE
ncbi:MAG: oligosaccharide flippase family protein [Sphingopyxis sp.]